MKELIKKLLRENLITEERYNLANLNDIILLSPSTNDNNGGLFLLYSINTKKPLGYISFGYFNEIDVYSVGGIYSKRGYGPLLYEIAMTYAYPKGLTLSQDGGTSQDAQNVWEKFFSRNDVKKEKIIRNEPSEKEIDLINGCDNDKNCLEWANKLINLHNSKFIFNLGKDNLLRLINNGYKYAKLNNISDDAIDQMSWDLE